MTAAVALALAVGLALVAPAGEAVGAVAVDAGLDLRAEHPNGTRVHVTAIRFGEDRITITLAVDNASERDIRFAAGTRRPITLRDDLGNAYVWSPPADDDRLPVPQGVRVEADLVFLGRVDPGAGELTLTLNDPPTPGRPDLDPRAVQPYFAFTIPVTAGGPAPADGQDGADARSRSDDRLPYDQPLDLQVVDERSRMTLSVRAVSFTLDTIVVDVALANRHSHDHAGSLQIGNGRTVLDDDLGNRYELIPPPDNPHLTGEAAQITSGRLTFVGGLHPGAGALTLRTNWHHHLDEPASLIATDPHPTIVVEDIPVQW